MTIWKYQVPFPGGEMLLPEGARILHVGSQDGVAHFWALCDPRMPKESRWFAVIGTGHELPDEAEVIGTWFDDPFVWHLIETPKEGQAMIGVNNTQQRIQELEAKLAEAEKEREQVRIRLGCIGRVSSQHEGHQCLAADCLVCWPGDIIKELCGYASQEGE